jgi:hypothetical protein
MKFDKLVEQILNEYAYDIQSRLKEIQSYKPAAQINMLLTDLEYASKPETKQSIEQALQSFDPELVKQAQAAKAQQKASVGGDVPPVGIPTRSNYLKKFMSRERNA